MAAKSKKKSRRSSSDSQLEAAGPVSPSKKPLRPIEEYLLDAADEISGDRIVVVSNAGGQAAAAIAQRHPNAQVVCNFLDAFLADSARARNEGIENLEITCLPDLPEETCNAVAIPFPSKGESELAREYLQQVLQRLAPNGRLFATSDNVRDRWLHEQLRASFQKVTNREMPKGRLYIASRPKPVKKLKDFSSWFAFRDGERLIHACSRPAVFSHRRMDNGARALIESLTIHEGPGAGEVVQAGFRVLDIGCGTGDMLRAFNEIGFKVKGTDISPSCEEFCDGLPFVAIDILENDLPYEDKAFDFIFSKSVIEHLSEPNRLFKESHRVLKNGGVSVIMCPSWIHNNWGPFYVDHTHVSPYL